MRKGTGKLPIQAIVTKDDRHIDGWVHGTTTTGEYYSAKLFDEGSVYGINKGRVSKLEISKEGKMFAVYERGWVLKPSTPEQKAAYQAIMRRLKEQPKSRETTKPSIIGELEESKAEVSNNRVFSVIITETFQKAVDVEAASREEAQKIAYERWEANEYHIDSQNFYDVGFNAIEKPAHTREDEIC